MIDLTPTSASDVPPGAEPLEDASRTHSDSWHRLAEQRVALRPHLTVHRQVVRGDRWQVLRDPFNNRFFRLSPSAYEFAARLRLDRTIDEVWRECQEADPGAPGQEEAVSLLAGLWQANLLHGTLAPDSGRLFERFRKGRVREIRSFWLSIMFARIPLLDPDRFLVGAMPIARIFLSWFGAILWLGVVGFGLKLVADHWDAVKIQTQGVLAPANLPMLYASLVLLKTCHEFGHAFLCRRFGGEVHTMGVMLLIFTPIPYVDATSSWSFRSRWQRALVGSGGILVELFLAGLATFVWTQTAPGVLNSIAYNVMFVASISTLAFNLNPLLRFDGYYILSDVLDLPNLHPRSARQLIHLCERYLFGLTRSRSPATSQTEAGWLTVFGLSSHAYRIFVSIAIAWFVADQWLLVGAVLALYCAVSFAGVPLFKLVRYLASSPRIEQRRSRAVAVVGGSVAGVLLFVGVIPLPHHFRAPGVLKAVEHSELVTETDGYLRRVTASGRRVERGELLVQQHNSELGFALAAARAQLAETDALTLRALRQNGRDYAPLEARAAAIRQRVTELERQQAALTITARHAGDWSAPNLDRMQGSWLAKGTSVGLLADSSHVYFSAIVSQTEASDLFVSGRLRRAEVRLVGDTGRVLAVSTPRMLPAGRRELPSAALGWYGGGTVPVEKNDKLGTRAQEQFFEVRAEVEPSAGVALAHGRSGWVRFTLPPEPLLRQWTRKLFQLLQQRFLW